MPHAECRRVRCRHAGGDGGFHPLKTKGGAYAPHGNGLGRQQKELEFRSIQGPVTLVNPEQCAKQVTRIVLCLHKRVVRKKFKSSWYQVFQTDLLADQ
jgi:hypothetical protein